MQSRIKCEDQKVTDGAGRSGFVNPTHTSAAGVDTGTQVDTEGWFVPQQSQAVCTGLYFK